MANRQPLHRRPSWAQHDRSYEHYMRKNLAADRSPCRDYGKESFSFDEAHLSKWQIDSALFERLPPVIRGPIVEWQYAGAAVCTALDRILKLDGEAIHRAYPDKSAQRHLSRHPSLSTSSTPPVAGDLLRMLVDATPPASLPVSPASLVPQQVAKRQRQTPLLPPPLNTASQNSDHGLDDLAMESPPFTPIDGYQSTPPTESSGISTMMIPDANQLSKHLSSSRIRRDSTVISASPPSGLGTQASSTPNFSFDESAWETYLSSYRAELTDLRSTAWVRFTGAGHIVHTLRVELAASQSEELTASDQCLAMAQFDSWWAAMNDKVALYDEKVHALEPPTLDFVRMERAAKGMPV